MKDNGYLIDMYKVIVEEGGGGRIDMVESGKRLEDWGEFASFAEKNKVFNLAYSEHLLDYLAKFKDDGFYVQDSGFLSNDSVIDEREPKETLYMRVMNLEGSPLRFDSLKEVQERLSNYREWTEREGGGYERVGEYGIGGRNKLHFEVFPVEDGGFCLNVTEERGKEPGQLYQIYTKSGLKDKRFAMDCAENTLSFAIKDAVVNGESYFDRQDYVNSGIIKTFLKNKLSAGLNLDSLSLMKVENMNTYQFMEKYKPETRNITYEKFESGGKVCMGEVFDYVTPKGKERHCLVLRDKDDVKIYKFNRDFNYSSLTEFFKQYDKFKKEQKEVEEVKSKCMAAGKSHTIA